MNDGDWVESLTALVETHEGEFKLVKYYKDWLDIWKYLCRCNLYCHILRNSLSLFLYFTKKFLS
jgi:hypothetical protein